jgi:choline dehydrogenase-like flavoprotein
MQCYFDYIIVGGGSAGSVLASRLSENPDISVCLVEAGGNGDSWTVNIPCAGIISLPTKINNWGLNTVPQKNLFGRQTYQPRGKCLGGSSAINAMVYLRGNKKNYDNWASLGNNGWSYEEVLPYFIKSERNNNINNEYHGNNGPLSVSNLRSDNPISNIFLNAIKEAGYPINNDFNGQEQIGFGLYQVTQYEGQRCSTAKAFIHPNIKRKNLTIITKTLTEKLIIQNRVTTGIECNRDGYKFKLYAKAEVILSAGAIHTPQILMLSGVGDSNELSKLGIKIQAHLPGVGKNFHDHPGFVFAYNIKTWEGTFGFSIPGLLSFCKEIKDYSHHKKGMLTSNYAECGGFFKTENNLEIPNAQLHFIVAVVDNHARNIHMKHGVSFHLSLLNPKSRGTIKLSGSNIRDPILIDPNFYGDQQDLQDMIDAYKISKKIIQSKKLQLLLSEDLVGSNLSTDSDIIDLLKRKTDSSYHPVGSCKMGTDYNSVVNSSLEVHGVKKLRIVDASIMPEIVNANTNATVIMIAEKAADLILKKRKDRLAIGTA